MQGDLKSVSLENASHAPDLRTNLLSVAKLTDRGYSVLFKKSLVEVINAKGNTELYAQRIGDLYCVQKNGEGACSVSSVKTYKAMIEVLHRRFGHVNVKDVSDAVRKGAVTGIQLTNALTKMDCDVCLKGMCGVRPE